MFVFMKKESIENNINYEKKKIRNEAFFYDIDIYLFQIELFKHSK